jgi:dihydropteroate synthase
LLRSAYRPSLTDAAPVWQIAGRRLTLDRPQIMGVINVTPDSFHSASRAPAAARAADLARRMAAEGADMLDIGAESTRPGAARVGAEEQISRLAPALEAIAAAGVAVPISVDTTLAAVARAALQMGAAVINDVSGGAEDPALLEVAAAMGAGLILMHRLASPEEDSYSDRYARGPEYRDVVADVRRALAGLLEDALARGVASEQIAVDPGLGFGKTVEQNLSLLARAGELAVAGRPVLIGASRKSFVGRVSLDSDSEPQERLAGSVAAAAVAVGAGALLIRTHDVGPTVEAARVAWAAAGKGAWKKGG